MFVAIPRCLSKSGFDERQAGWLGKAARRRSVTFKPPLNGCYSYREDILTYFALTPTSGSQFAIQNQKKRDQKLLLLCPLHNRFQHPLGKISLLLDVPAQMLDVL